MKARSQPFAATPFESGGWPGFVRQLRTAWRKTISLVAQVSKPAVSPISKSAGRSNDAGALAFAVPAGWETRDTADWEVCATIRHAPGAGWRRILRLAVSLALVAALAPFTARASIIYETSGEFLSAGDFNGDGIQDVLVLDKLTGNVRVGLADSNGALSWSAPLVTGAENVTGCAVGHWLQTTRDAVAVTAPALNRVNLVDLSNTNAAPPPMVVTPNGLGPHMLVALPNPLGSTPPAYPYLLAASSDNSPPSERLDLMSISAGNASPVGQFAENGPFDRGNALPLSITPATFAVGLMRGTNDALRIWEFTNAPRVILSLNNLPAGSDYTFGVFDGDALPRFILYVPGGTNLNIVPLQQSGGSLYFGSSLIVPMSEPVQHVFFLDQGANGSALIQFGDGVQGLRLSGGAPVLASVYRSGTGAAGNVFTGIVPLGNGRFALLDGPPGSPSSSHAQVIQFDGTNYTQLSSGNLPSTTASNTRANVWLFHAEPFVSPQPGFIASVSTPDWSDGVSGLPGSLTVSVETDGGTNSGLGNLTTKTLATPPANAAFALPNQYRPDISLFSYAGPRTPEPVAVTIWPPPGTYTSPIQITFSNLNTGDKVFYRVGSPDSWHQYAAAFSLTNDATVQFYGTNTATSIRSQLQSATYALNNNGQPISTLNLTNGTSTTNPPVPPINPLIVPISSVGTLFYDRRSPDGVYSIWAINLDGSDDTFVTTGARPRVSRDGRNMAFLRGGSPLVTQGNLWVRDLQTGQETLLYSNFDYTIGYDWDNTGTNLVFDNSCSLWRISPGSGGMATFLPLTTDCYDNAPAVNPVDGRLAFHNLNTSTGVNGLYVTTPAITNKVRIVDVPGASWPEWSPDGQWLVFADGNTANTAFTGDGGTNLWVVKPDGSSLSQITAFADGTSRFPYGAEWSPDGSTLIGAGNLYGTNGLWLIPLTAGRTDCLGTAILLPTSPGDAIDFAGSIVAPQTVASLPRLFIRRDATDLIVYWSTNFVGYTLEWTTNLAPSAVWQPVAGPYPVVAFNYEHREPLGDLALAKFFRLRYTGVVAGPPQLFIRLQTNTVLLYWDSSFTGYNLETTTNLSAGNWTTINGPYAPNGDYLEHQEPLSNATPKRYYRLSSP